MQPYHHSTSACRLRLGSSLIRFQQRPESTGLHCPSDSAFIRCHPACATDFWSFRYASSLHPFGSTELRLSSGSTLVISPTGSTSVLWQSGSMAPHFIDYTVGCHPGCHLGHHLATPGSSLHHRCICFFHHLRLYSLTLRRPLFLIQSPRPPSSVGLLQCEDAPSRGSFPPLVCYFGYLLISSHLLVFCSLSCVYKLFSCFSCCLVLFVLHTQFYVAYLVWNTAFVLFY